MVAQSFKNLLDLEVQDKKKLILRNIVFGEDALITLGFISDLADFIPIPDSAKPYFISSFLFAILAKPFLFSEPIRHGAYIIASNLLLLSWLLFSYGLIELLAKNFPIYLIAFIVVGAMHLYLIIRNQAVIRNFCRINRTFGIFVVIAYLLSHGSAMFVYLRAVFRGGF